jgi:hypothetical protein
MTFAVHALGNAGFMHQIDETLIQNAGTNAAGHSVAGDAFDDDVAGPLTGRQR